jgi:hypothetical protein
VLGVSDENFSTLIIVYVHRKIKIRSYQIDIDDRVYRLLWEIECELDNSYDMIWAMDRTLKDIKSIKKYIIQALHKKYL